jgi:ubiquinone/menaquinone biosynthesis C-methylase UbiE
MMTVASAYDNTAPSFDRHRQLPQAAVSDIRMAVLAAAGSPRARVLDLGAGTGRIGRTFVAAGDDYVGVDLSLGMLREFARQAGQSNHMPALVCADGQFLPFRDAVFDALLLIQVVGAAKSWRDLVTEARRVLRPSGALIIGHAVFPSDGVDAKMKERLAAILKGLGVDSYHANTRGVVQPWLESEAMTNTRIRAADWISYRTPRMFRERQPTGARFSTLPKLIQNEALRMLEFWAAETFGSLDATFREQHEFELKVFKF